MTVDSFAFARLPKVPVLIRPKHEELAVKLCPSETSWKVRKDIRLVSSIRIVGRGHLLHVSVKEGVKLYTP